MAMATQFTLVYEGPPSCIDCQRRGVQVCDHIGFSDAAWIGIPGAAVQVPGLDPAYVHTVRSADIAPDRKTLTLTVETERPPVLELARHLSTRTDQRTKASIRAVHHETGDVLAEGRYDAFLQAGQQVCINGDLHLVQTISHPNRQASGMCPRGVRDVQVAMLVPDASVAIQSADAAPLPVDINELRAAGARDVTTTGEL